MLEAREADASGIMEDSRRGYGQPLQMTQV